MDALDTALEILANSDHPELSTHGPMVVEALCDLGFAARAADWAHAYRAGMAGMVAYEAGSATCNDLPDSWREAFGQSDLRSAWVARFDRELGAEDWRSVSRRWLPRLLPGMACDAAHALIRTGHALRSLGRCETDPRRHELAEALAYWASAYATLPGEPRSGRPMLSSAAIAGVTPIPLDEQTHGGLITDRIATLTGRPKFGAEVSRVWPGDDLGEFANDLAVIAARLYLANADRGRVIDFIHALDGVAAVRELLPYLETETACEALFYGWQLVAALHASAGGPLAPATDRAVAPEEVPDLVRRAVEVGGAHAIKFAQACVSEFSLQPDPIFHAALKDMVERMELLKERLNLVI